MSNRPVRLMSVSRLFISATLFLFYTSTASAQNFVELALGGSNICAIDDAGTLECTTQSPENFLPPDDGTLYQSVSSGLAHSCAITLDGEMRCWGSNLFGQLDAPTINGSFVSLSAGANHTCAIDTDTQAHCWGLNTAGQTDVPGPNIGFVSVHTSSGSSCGVKDTGELVCWTTDTMITGNLPEFPGYTDVVLGQGGANIQSCGLTPEGVIDCWASNDISPNVPISGPYTQIGSETLWLCGLGPDGILDCNFSTNAFGDTLFGTTVNDRNQELFNDIAALPPLSSFEILTQSSVITNLCGLTLNGTVECVGSSLPANTVPGDSSDLLVDIPIPEDLDFAVYSDSTIELFWDATQSFAAAGANIYRDGELLAFTTNRTSFIDDTLEPDVDYVYTIALVELTGNEGAMSDPIIVSTSNRGQSGGDGNDNDSGTGSDGGPGNTLLSHPGQPTNIFITRYSNTSLEIFWDRSSDNPTYLIYRNGEFVAFASGPSYFDRDVNAITDYHYTIVVQESNGDNVFGVGFVNEPALTVE